MGNFSYYKHLRLYLPYQLRPPYLISVFWAFLRLSAYLLFLRFCLHFAMGASLLNGNQFITINIHNIEEAVRHIDFYDF